MSTPSGLTRTNKVTVRKVSGGYILTYDTRGQWTGMHAQVMAGMQEPPMVSNEHVVADMDSLVRALAALLADA